ncbi:MAG: ParA family protein [SAR324 cluster bacterium]|nr:ParA family protein [SAR324 cluster bacterium]
MNCSRLMASTVMPFLMVLLFAQTPCFLYAQSASQAQTQLVPEQSAEDQGDIGEMSLDEDQPQELNDVSTPEFLPETTVAAQNLAEDMPEMDQEMAPAEKKPPGFAEKIAETTWIRGLTWTILISMATILLSLASFKWVYEWREKNQPDLELQFSDSQKQVRPSLKDANTSVFAVLSGKGGSGKSSTASSIAHLLARCGFKTLIVDMDFFTHGATFLAFSGKLPSGTQALPDYFTDNPPEEMIEPILLKKPFTRENLYILPSQVNRETNRINLTMTSRYEDLITFTKRLSGILSEIKEQHSFDYVILDTRGGTDVSNVGSALAASSYVIITELDKPSWQMADQLVESLRDGRKIVGSDSQCLGFIINKNSLPSDKIEQYLQRRWDIPHLCTIPYDPEVIRTYQDSTVVVSENLGAGFSREVIHFIEKQICSSGWNNYNNAHFQALNREPFWVMLKNLFT